LVLESKSSTDEEVLNRLIDDGDLVIHIVVALLSHLRRWIGDGTLRRGEGCTKTGQLSPHCACPRVVL
jgi:hypothetical protein